MIQEDFNAACVECGGAAIACCVVEGDKRGGTLRDWCADCIADGKESDNFGRCYVCRDFRDHAGCIGVPCQCPCPGPSDVVTLDRDIEAARRQLAALETRRSEVCS